MKHIVCHSGGHSSALVAIEVSRKFGKENVILLNHDMHHSVEHADIKRFKQEVADYIGAPITFASRKNAEQDQFDVCVESKAFKVDKGPELCTARLKTEPFHAWLDANIPEKDCIIYYGFDNTDREISRMQRRTGIMAAKGYRTDCPLALWKERSIFATEDVGITRPSTYAVFTHGNCIGCLKAGWQHWYIVYCTRPDIWLKAKWAEDEIGHSIHHDGDESIYLEDMEPKFEAMRKAGIPATEHIPQQRFWAQSNRIVAIKQIDIFTPCECTET